MRKLYLIVCVLFALQSARAQDAKTCFLNMPDSITPLLTAINKADFIDFLESNMKAVVKNKFGNSSEMTNLSPDYIRLKMTESSQWEMKLLPLNDSLNVICVVSTACAPVCDSYVRFYSSTWGALAPDDYLTPPVMDDYFISPDSAQLYDYGNLRLKTDMLLAQAELEEESNAILFTFTTPRYMEEEDALKIAPFLAGPVPYIWENGRFVKAGFHSPIPE